MADWWGLQKAQNKPKAEDAEHGTSYTSHILYTHTYASHERC